MWDSHRPLSTTLQEREGVGSRRHVCAILPLHQLWGAMAGYVVAPCPPSPLVLTKNPGNNDDQVVVVIPAPLSLYSLPSSVLPHHPHLLLFLFGSDVAMVAFDVVGVRRMGGGGDVATRPVRRALRAFGICEHFAILLRPRRGVEQSGSSSGS